MMTMVRREVDIKFNGDDVIALLGLDPNRNAFDVWVEKSGRGLQKEKPFNILDHIGNGLAEAFQAKRPYMAFPGLVETYKIGYPLAVATPQYTLHKATEFGYEPQPYGVLVVGVNQSLYTHDQIVSRCRWDLMVTGYEVGYVGSLAGSEYIIERVQPDENKFRNWYQKVETMARQVRDEIAPDASCW